MVDEKQELNNQKEQLKKDVEFFRSEYLEKIKHGENDKFDSLYVFGNFYQLAIEANPELAKKFAEYDEKFDKTMSQEQALSLEQDTRSKQIINSYGLSVTTAGLDRDSTNVYLHDEQGLVARCRSDYFNDHGFSADLTMIDHVLKQIGYLSQKTKKKLDALKKLPLTKQMKSSIVKKLNSDENLYFRVKDHIEDIMAIKQQLTDLAKEIEPKSKEVKSQVQQLKQTREELKSILDKKSTTILALAYLGMYSRNYEYLRMSKLGAKKQLQELVTEGQEYYANASLNSIADKIDKWITTGKIASALHESWREGRKQADGSYAPRWKKVTDPTFIKKVESMKELPSNIRIVDGKVEQDIANTSFLELCLDYQIENMEAAELVAEVVSQKEYTADEAGKVGDMIHEKWLERNPWAKGSDLDVDFIDLIKSEKVKDLVQYEIAKEVMSQEENKDII